MKKKSKLKELKNHIQELETRLEHKNQSLSDAYEKIRRYEQQEGERSLYKNFQKEEENRKSADYLEIIRWLIKPETTKDPFNRLTEEKQKKESRINF